MKLTSPLAQLIGALVLLGVVTGLCVYWYERIAAESLAVVQVQAQIELQQQSAKRIASARAALTQIAGDEAAVQAYFVSDATVVTFIDDLEARGTRLGASVQVLSVSATKEGTHPALALSITITGPFDAIMRALGSIEYAPYDIRMKEVTVNQDKDGNWVASTNFQVGSAPAPVPGVPSATISEPTTSSSTAATTTPGDAPQAAPVTNSSEH